MIHETPTFHDSLADCAFWLWREGGEALAKRFQDAVRETLRWLHDMPRAGKPWQPPGEREIRVRLVADFPNYLLFYEPIESGLRALLVVHGSRDFEGLLDRV